MFQVQIYLLHDEVCRVSADDSNTMRPHTKIYTSVDTPVDLHAQLLNGVKTQKCFINSVNDHFGQDLKCKFWRFVIMNPH